MTEGTRTGGSRVPATLALALALGAGGTTAAAQPAPPSSYQLPPASPTPDPMVQGPVIDEYPVATPTTAATPTPPVITPAPRATPTAAPSPAATRPPARPAPAASPTAAAPPIATPPPQLEASPTVEPDTSLPATTATAEPLPERAPEPWARPAEPAPADERWPWYAAAAALAAALATALFLLARRRSDRDRAEGEPVDHAPVPAPAPSPSPPAAPLTPAPPTRPASIPPASPTPASELPDGPALVLRLEARRFSATLVNASLDYRLRVTNAGSHPLENVTIAGDMIGAHASLPVEAQFAGTGADLEPRHSIASLAPGETAELSGTIRLPLAGATAIRQGAAALFVPLVRLCARAGAQGPAFASTHVVGEVPTRPGGGLRPFRLDLGPRIYGEIEQRKLAVPA